VRSPDLQMVEACKGRILHPLLSGQMPSLGSSFKWQQNDTAAFLFFTPDSLPLP